MSATEELLSPLEPISSRASRTSRASIRRLSSYSATREDLIGGPTVLVPPQNLMARTPSNAHDTALAMEMAKFHLAEEDHSGEVTPEEPEEPSTTTDKYAFAFDIDGVLIRGGEPIPEAVEAMKVLNGENEYGIKVYCPRQAMLLIDLTHSTVRISSLLMVVGKPRRNDAWT